QASIDANCAVYFSFGLSMIRCCLILIRRCTVFLLTVNTSAELIKLMENHHPSPQAMQFKPDGSKFRLD
ncbi:hypothetical protein D917_08578, partial [Trichinella nativa]